jgi:hypothetical protein
LTCPTHEQAQRLRVNGIWVYLASTSSTDENDDASCQLQDLIQVARVQENSYSMPGSLTNAIPDVLHRSDIKSFGGLINYQDGGTTREFAG